jgi:hypothetical protein
VALTGFALGVFLHGHFLIRINYVPSQSQEA